MAGYKLIVDELGLVSLSRCSIASPYHLSIVEMNGETYRLAQRRARQAWLYAAHRSVLLSREQTPRPRHFQAFVERLFEAFCVIGSIFEAAEVIYAMRIASLANYDSYFS
jgi:hypothetical protein